MNQNPNMKTQQPIMKDRIGHFQISLWNTKRLIRAKNNFEAEREIDVFRTCIQNSRFRPSDQSWLNQSIWVNVEEIRDLRQLLDQLMSNPEISGEEIREISLEPETQSKWMEAIRSRKICGFPTQVKWVWAAMNPMSYSATMALDEALIGRFAVFLYPPDVLQMSEADRIRVTTHINGDDAPSLNEWLPGTNGKTVSQTQVNEIGEKLKTMLGKAAVYFNQLRKDLNTLSEFLAKFADLLMRESKGEISLDGRRLGFIYHNILANRAIELAKSEILDVPLGTFVNSARYVVQSSIPIGLNDASLKREEAVHKMEICFDLLSSYFDAQSEMEKVNRIYELFTTDNLLRKTEILLQENLGEFVKSKAWNDLINSGKDITLLAYTALQVEAHKPGILPPELLESLSGKIAGKDLNTKALPNLRGESIEYIEEIEELLKQNSDLGCLAAFHRVDQLAGKNSITLTDVNETQKLIEPDIQTFYRLIQTAQESA